MGVGNFMSPQLSSGTSGDGGSLQTCQDLEDLLKSQNSTYTEGELRIADC